MRQMIPVKIQIPITYEARLPIELSDFTNEVAKLSIKPKMIPVAVTMGWRYA